MQTRRTLWIFLPAVLFAQTGWSLGKKGESAPGNSPAITSATVQASNAFACDLLRALAKRSPGQNAFISPWSISTALAMTMEGARQKTALEMGQVLRLPKRLLQGGSRPWKLDDYHAGFAELQRPAVSAADSEKDRGKRAEIAALRTQLDTLKRRLRDGALDDLLRGGAAENSPLRVEAQTLATQINKLQSEIVPFDLRAANSIWAERTYPFDPAFEQVVARYYGRGLLRQADFINQFPAERDKINQWVEAQTEHRIKELIPELDPSEARHLRLILVNAIYFKGQWDQPFDPQLTKPAPFSLGDGRRVDAALMQRTVSGRYGAFNADGTSFDTPRTIDFLHPQETYPKGNGFLIAEIPYQGNTLSMVVIAPQNPRGLGALEAKLTGEALDGWLAKLQARDVHVTMPRFKLETAYELGDILQAAGMKLAFDKEAANFTGMSLSRKPDDNLFISRVVHKAFVDVNEEGTEAAAATAVMIAVPVSGSSLSPFTPELRADRPFLFLIRDVHTGAVLFAGRLTKP